MLVSQHDTLTLCYQQRKCTHLLQFGRCCSPQFHTLGLADFLQFKISVCFAALAIVLEWHLVPHLNSIDLFQPGYKQNEHLPLTCVCSCWRSDLDTIQLNWAFHNSANATKETFNCSSTEAKFGLLKTFQNAVSETSWRWIWELITSVLKIFH